MGRPPVINRDQVVDAALGLIDREGLDAISIERIAKEVGVRGPTLYHHFADKAEILAEAAGKVLGNLDVPDDVGDWQDFMIATSIAFYHRLQQHPNAVAILIQSLPDSAALPEFERAARLLAAAGIDPALHLLLMEGTEKIVWGWALQRAMMAVTGERLAPDRFQDRWPALMVASQANALSDEEMLEQSILAFHHGVLSRVE